MLRRTSRLVAAVVLTAAAGVVVTSQASPASAAACSTSSGVTVVVDFHELGGGVQSVCDASGAGKYAAAQFGDAGFSLERVQRQPGFVCRVNGAPSDDPCVNTPPADAYWGLWWSNGTSGSWTYASQGVDSLKVPEGGSVALSWNGSSTKSPPGAAAPAHASASPSPSPSSSPSSHPTTSGGGSQPTSGASPGGSTTPGASPSATASGSAQPSTAPGDKRSHGTSGGKRPGHPASGKHHGKAGREDGSTPAAEPSDTASAAPGTTTADPPATGDGGLPTWTGPAAIGALFVAAGGTALLRRRRGSTGP